MKILYKGVNLSKEKFEFIKSVYYFGARYYWSGGGLWLSVDPLADRYPFLSPYVYGAGSPLVLVDVDGMQTVDDFVEDSKTFKDNRPKYSLHLIGRDNERTIRDVQYYIGRSGMKYEADDYENLRELARSGRITPEQFAKYGRIRRDVMFEPAVDRIMKKYQIRVPGVHHVELIGCLWDNMKVKINNKEVKINFDPETRKYYGNWKYKYGDVLTVEAIGKPIVTNNYFDDEEMRRAVLIKAKPYYYVKIYVKEVEHNYKKKTR